MQAPHFSALNLDATLMQALQKLGYDQPTPIQVEAIPAVLAGHDLMAGAQTGTGKTAAFSLPLLQLLLPHANTSASPARHPIRALVLVPTRELAIQVADSIKQYAEFTGLRTCVVFGGVDIKTQTPQLMRGVEILVATPGRLLDHVEQRTLQLNQVQVLVLDEADRMLDMGFMPDLKRILGLLPKQRQNLMFSATFSNEIKKLSEAFLQQPKLIEVARSNATNDNVTQQIYLVDSKQKQSQLLTLLREYTDQQAIVFTKTKISASKLARFLQREGLAADAIHGDKSQQERIQALDKFKRGEIVVLVATDVAARGLDIDQLPLVINYEIPSAPEDYVHRIGRTGRAGASGIALSLVSAEEEKYLNEIEKLIKRQLDKQRVSPVANGQAPERSDSQRTRSERSRSERSGSERSGTRSSDSSSARSLSSATKRNEKLDPFFSQPYQPSGDAPAIKPSSALSGNASNKKPVAALLGGLPRKN
jgi:superfamily II DNA/RNA helicase